MGDDAEKTKAMRSAIVVGHATARHVAAELDRARTMLLAAGVKIRQTYVVESDKQLRKAVRRAIKSEPDVVVVGGGDGTMTKVVGAFAEREAVLGVLPLGTGNSFSQSLGIGTELEKAVQTIAHGTVEKVDLGTIDGDYFANFATIGFATLVAGETPTLLKRVAGAAAYALAGIVPFLRARTFACRIKSDEDIMDIRTYQVLVASGRFYGDSPLTPGAGLESGKLALFATSDENQLDLAKTYLALMMDRQTLLTNAHVIEARSIKIRAKPRQRVAIDGVTVGYTPVRFGVAPRALRVLVPGRPPGPSA